MPCTHVPPERIPLCTIHASIQLRGVLWRCEASMKWFQGGSKASQLYPSQLWKSRKWQQAPEGRVRLRGWRGFTVSPTVWAWLVRSRSDEHPLSSRGNHPKESSHCFTGAGLACRSSSAPGVGVLAVVSGIIPSSVISALSCPMDLFGFKGPSH